MFGFKGKGKDKEKQQKDDHSATTEPSAKSKKSKKQPEMTKEELRRLEETKQSLFGSLTKKPKVTGEGGDHSSKNKPEVPPRPDKLRNPPSLAPIDDRPRNTSFDEPSSPYYYEVEYGFHPLKTFNLPGLNLPALGQTLISERTLKLNKLPSGEFGFSLRRAQIIDRYTDHTEERRTVIFAEPIGEEKGPFTYQNTTGKHPDRQVG